MIALNFLNGPELGDVEGILVGKFHMDPRLEMWKEIWSEILVGSQLGHMDGLLPGDCKKASRWDRLTEIWWRSGKVR